MRRVTMAAAVAVTGLATVASAELLGILPGFPNIAFLTQGTTTYNAISQVLLVESCPTAIQFEPGGFPEFITGDDVLAINIIVDNDGNLVGGRPGPDLLIQGDVSSPNGPLSGVLLEGEICEFGSQDLSGEPNDDGTDFFDFRFIITGGALVDPWFLGTDIGLVLTSENSNWDGTWDENFLGGAKGGVGPIPQIGNCEDATSLSLPAVVIGDTTCATVENLDDCGTSINSPGIWFSVTGTGTTITANTCGPATDYDTKISVFCGDCIDLPCVGGNDDFCGLQSQFSWCSQAGEEYLILVHGFNGASGTFELEVTEDGIDCTPSGGEVCVQPPTGACCFTDGSCTEVSEDQCNAAMGDFQGVGTTCFVGGVGSVDIFQSPEVPIPDNDPGGISDTITVNQDFPVTDVDIDLHFMHSFVGDLIITVEHNGQTVIIVDRPGVPKLGIFGCGANNYLEVILDDAGTGGSIEDACEDNLSSPPNYTPNNPLSAFNGMNAMGDWTITVSDNAGLDTGVFSTWSIHLEGGDPICPQPPDTGACCFGDGGCQILTQAQCDMQMGDYQGDGTVCMPNPCPQLEACCFMDGTCQDLFPADCVSAGGAPQGPGTDCDPNPCPQPPATGACCLSNGSCLILTEVECEAIGKDYQGDDTVCEPNTCPQPEACCFDDGGCVEVLPEECGMGGGIPQGPGSTCTPNPCPATGACCFFTIPDMDGDGHADGHADGHGDDGHADDGHGDEDASCLEVTEAECDALMGTFQGVGTICDEWACESVCEQGEPRVIIMQYTGEGCDGTDTLQGWQVRNCDEYGTPQSFVFIRATDSPDPNVTDTKVWFEGNVSVNEQYEIDAANGGELHLKYWTYVHIFDQEGGALLETAEICTSCTVPLIVGDQWGSNRLIDRVSEYDAVPFSVCNAGKPQIVTMLYNGAPANAMNHLQDPGKVTCEDYGPLLNSVYIVANDFNLHNYGVIWFADTVNIGSTFDIDSMARGLPHLKDDTYLHIFDQQGGTLLQRVKFHSSCSQPLFEGDQLGGNLVVACLGSNNELTRDRCGATERPSVLEMLYRGDSCDWSMNHQDGEAESCGDFAPLQDQVFIVANDARNPNFGLIWFEGTVDIGMPFALDASYGGRTFLSDTTFIHVYDAPNGTLLQRIRLTTSCNEPLNLHDQFGAMELIDVVTSDGRRPGRGVNVPLPGTPEDGENLPTGGGNGPDPGSLTPR